MTFNTMELLQRVGEEIIWIVDTILMFITRYTGIQIVKVDKGELLRKFNEVLEEDDDVHLSRKWMKPATLYMNAWSGDPNIRPSRLMAIHSQLNSYIENDRQISKYLKENPSVLQIPIQRPIFIAGLPRTGTTYLLNLLAKDPGNLAPPLWQLLSSPVPPTLAEDPAKIKSAQFIVDCFMNAESKMKRYANSLLPDECAIMLDQTLCGRLGQNLRLGMDDYYQWYNSPDPEVHDTVYRFYKKFLQILAVKQGKGSRRYVRKDFGHMARLDSILKVFPDACIIHPTRNLKSIVGSTSSLYECVLKSSHRNPDKHQVANQALNHLSFFTDAFLKFRQEYDHILTPGSKSQFLDINYNELVETPMLLVKKIYDCFDMTLTPEADVAMRDYIKENPQYKYGRHVYNLEEYGISEREIQETFEDYVDYFNIQ
ncbi:unnamed protein product [Owenia fusiformis]|uniref:Uncharacterized protein n=1 Tax=Owenia fusiformis TaxID=6347 RepID=A0A8J1TC49_OWEFU|nr:unnamed protein product [Owenia fusiformis]